VIDVHRQRVRALIVLGQVAFVLGSLFLLFQDASDHQPSADIVETIAGVVAYTGGSIGQWLLVTWFPRPLPIGIRWSFRVSAASDVALGVGQLAILLHYVSGHLHQGYIDSAAVVLAGSLLTAGALLYWSFEPDAPGQQYQPPPYWPPSASPRR
jgi:hypothetical protein